MARVCVLHLVPGAPEFGIWCPACLLPSGYQVRVYALCDSGPRKVGITRRCHDCGTDLKAGANGQA